MPFGELPGKYPGSHLPRDQLPNGTTFDNVTGMPSYPPGTTCKMLGERELGLPWHYYFVWCTIFLAVYICWPIYLCYLLNRRRMGQAEAYEAFNADEQVRVAARRVQEVPANRPRDRFEAWTALETARANAEVARARWEGLRRRRRQQAVANQEAAREVDLEASREGDQEAVVTT